MLAQKTFIKKTRRGNIIKVVREHYLRYLPLHYPAPFAVFFWAHLIVQGRYLVWGRRLCPLWSRWARIDFKQSKGHRSQPDRKQMWKFWPFSPWNMILWCTKHISFHCEGAEKRIFHALFMISNLNYVLWRLLVLILLISTHPFILSIYHILDFWSKIRFRIHVIIIEGQMRPLKKIHKKLP